MIELDQFPTSLRRHAVGYQSTHGETIGPWQQLGDLDIEAVRQRYDAGLVELAQGRSASGFILFAIPRRHKIERPDQQKLILPPSAELHRRRANQSFRPGACV
jgi:hypothetical protein